MLTSICQHYQKSLLLYDNVTEWHFCNVNVKSFWHAYISIARCLFFNVYAMSFWQLYGNIAKWCKFNINIMSFWGPTNRRMQDRFCKHMAASPANYITKWQCCSMTVLQCKCKVILASIYQHCQMTLLQPLCNKDYATVWQSCQMI